MGGNDSQTFSCLAKIIALTHECMVWAYTCMCEDPLVPIRIYISCFYSPKGNISV